METETASTVQEKMGCEHYFRKCSLQCPECNEFYICRFCHDEKWEIQVKDPKLNHKINSTLDVFWRPSVTMLNRHAVKHIKCLECDNIQAPSERCENCGVVFAGYCCFICNLFDDEGDEKQLFHCDQCGICRQGGKESSFHCDTCDICLPLSIKEEHTCKNYREEMCPICFEGFYNIKDGGCLLNCGHLIHSKCFDSYFNTHSRCPICKKFPFGDEVKEEFNKMVEEECNNTVMSQELANIPVTILCNECLEK